GEFEIVVKRWSDSHGFHASRVLVHPCEGGICIALAGEHLRGPDEKKSAGGPHRLGASHGTAGLIDLEVSAQYSRELQYVSPSFIARTGKHVGGDHEARLDLFGWCMREIGDEDFVQNGLRFAKIPESCVAHDRVRALLRPRQHAAFASEPRRVAIKFRNKTLK